ncbi:DUF6766 family protein [Streptomyces sp. NBC_01803]|uniref:DUF6766 family protein n=1 Tax=Streptomyces sp. NBC_01803 TaxID=2975946 RepID=UPI002DDB76F6|nr:DUF6766 family protein [Streptomyces sp. NBC_01803]
MRRFAHDNGPSLASGCAFLLAPAGQAVAGHAEDNSERRAEGAAPVPFESSSTSADFAVDVTENWPSELRGSSCASSPPAGSSSAARPSPSRAARRTPPPATRADPRAVPEGRKTPP